MNIAIITDHIPSKWAHSINTMKIAQGFLELGHEVEILTIKRYLDDLLHLKIKNVHKFYGIEKEIKIKYFRDYSTHYFRDIKIYGEGLSLATKFITNLIPKLEILIDPEKRINSYCQSKGFDFAFYRRTERAMIYNIRSKINTIADMHSFRIDNQKELKILSSLSNSKYFKGIITLNNFLRHFFIKIGFPGDKIIVMDNCVNINRFDEIPNDKKYLRDKLGLPLNENIVLYSGSLHKNKGIETVLRAAKLLENEDFSYYFIGGRHKEIKHWQKILKKYNIKAKIRFLGWKARNYIPLYLKSADILLAPYSKTDPTLRFISPVKIIEYKASKVPFIAAKIKRITEICEAEECLFFEIEDHKDLSEKIRILMEDNALRAKLINKAYIKAQTLTIKKKCERIIEMIR